MNKRITHISSKPGEKIRYKTGNGFRNDLLPDSEDSALFEAISDYMKGSLDIEDVKNDQALSYAKQTVAEMISDYNRNSSANKENEKFIKGEFAENGDESGLTDEISFIRQEIDDNKLNEITAEWVKEWHQKKQSVGISNTKTKEISDFVTDSLNSQVAIPAEALHNTAGKSLRKSLFIRYATLSAAALIGVFLVIRSLLPSSDPEKLFNSYYKPFAAISTTTRSINNNVSDNYSSGIAYYKSGNFQEAAMEFAKVSGQNPDAVSPKFFEGLSQLGMMNYDKAINLLSGVTLLSGEYSKEARWYLGLAYLRTADRQKAAECFEYLAKSDGFYRDRSEKILRRLK
jgi:tetratricopeptide (TPR) repeat protein